VVVIFFITGCRFLTTTEGDLLLIISPAIGKQIQTPDFNIASYTMSGQGPAGASFLREGITGSSVLIESLAVGSWQITVEALNASSEIIGAGSSSVNIVAGKTTEVTIVVVPLTGTGELQLTVSWPSDLLFNWSVTGTLTPLGGTTSDLVFTPGTDSATYQNAALDAGYYALTVVLREDGEAVWGAAEAVPILAGLITTGTFVLSASDIDPGNVVVTIIPDLQEPFEIIFEGHREALFPSASMTVSATTNPMQSSPSFQWYLDGSRLDGETGSSITIDAGLDEARYRLDLLVQANEVLSSSGFSFTVSAYSRTPVFIVHGYGMDSSYFTTMRSYLEQQAGYPPELIRIIDLVPSTGSNISAAETQIQPAVEQFLEDVNDYIGANVPGIPSKTKVDLVSHSMGGLSTRWYAARVRPDRVRIWASLAGANHGTSEDYFADRTDDGSLDLYPAFATNETLSYIQYQLNGAPLAADTDESPYGLGSDTPGVSVVPPDADATRSILYVTIAATPDDIWIDPDESAQIDGAGGVVLDIPGDLPVIELSDGNYEMTHGIGHDPMLNDTQTIRLLQLVLDEGP